jgi:hypothetical protein
MIAVQVRNEDVRDLAAADFVTQQLHLGAFSTIDQVIVAVVGQYLTGGVAVKCRNCRIIA